MSEDRKVPVVLLAKDMVRPEAKLIEQLAKRQAARADFICVDTGANAVRNVTEAGCGIVFFVISAREDLVEVLNALITLKPLLRAGQCKVFGFELLNSPKIHSVLMSKGCSEVLDTKVTPKTLQFKLERTLSSLKRSVKTTVDAQPTRVGRDSRAGDEDGDAPSRLVDWADPQEFASDCWILQKKSEVRFVNGHWFVKLIGPPPSAGKWEEAGKLKWKWKPRAQPDPFITDEGAWIFVGKQPEFNWKTLKWQFVGKAPTLAFEVGGQNSFLRFEPRVNGIWIRRNSEACKAHLAGIQRALSMETRFQKEGEGAGAKDFRGQREGLDAPGNWSLDAESDDLGGPSDATEEADEEFLSDWSGAKPEKTRKSNRDESFEDAEKPGAPDFAVKLEDESEGIDLSLDAAASADLDRMTKELTFRMMLWPQSAAGADGGAEESTSGAGIKVQLVDWMDDQLVVRVTDSSPFAGDQANCVLKAWLDPSAPAQRIEGLAKVELIEQSNDGETLVTLRLPNGSLDQMTALMAAFEERQASVKDFMKAARGY